MQYNIIIINNIYKWVISNIAILKNTIKKNKKQNLKNSKIQIQSGNLSAFTDSVNARTCPVSSTVSIALTSLNLPSWQF